MKVLHVLRSSRAEGTVKLAIDWLQDQRIAQEVLVLEKNPSELREALQQRARWFSAGNALPPGIAKYAQIVTTVYRTCMQRRPDVLVCWTNGFSSWVLLGARLAGVDRLITHAGNPPTATIWGRIQTVWSLGIAWSVGARMICCSHYVAEAFRQAPGAVASVLRVVYNCAPVDSIRRAAAEARAARVDRSLKLIMVATLESHKDHRTLLRAMPAIVQVLPGIRLRLAGDGSLRSSLQQLARELGLGEAVEFLGSRNDIPRLLGDSDLFVFSTTVEEGLGTVLVEALAAGLPVVASDVPACREALANGQWGTLVPPGDPVPLARAIVAALTERATTQPRREPATDLRRFQPQAMMSGYLQAVAS